MSRDRPNSWRKCVTIDSSFVKEINNEREKKKKGKRRWKWKIYIKRENLGIESQILTPGLIPKRTEGDSMIQVGRSYGQRKL